MGESLADLVVKILMDNKDFNSKLNQLDKEVQNKFGAIQKHGMQLAAGLGAASVSIGALGVGVMNAASEFEVLKLKLKMAEGSTAAASQKFNELMTITKKATDIDLTELIGTHNIMKKLSAESTKAIPALAGAANELKESGVSISAVGKNVALFMKGGKQASRAILQLERQLGITMQTLKDFDSSFDMTGKNVKQNGEILVKYLNAQYGKNLDEFAKTNKSLMGELTLTWKEFSSEIGETMIPTVNEFLTSGIEMMKSFKEMNPQVKSAIGNFLMLAPPILGAVGGLSLVITQAAKAIPIITGLASSIGLTTLAVKGMEAATVLLTSSLGPWAALLVVLIGYYTWLENKINDDIKASRQMADEIQDQSEKERSAAQAFKKYQQGRKMTAEEVSKAITFAQMKVNNANEAGSKELQKKAMQDLKNLRDIQKGYKDTEKAAKDLAAAQSVYSGGVGTFMTSDVKIKSLERELQLGNATKAQKKELLEIYQQELRDQVGITNSRITGSELWSESVKREGELISRIRELEKEADSESVSLKKNGYDKKLRAGLDYLADLKAQNQLSTQDEINGLKRILKTYELTTEDRKQIQRQVWQLENNLRQDKTAKEKKSADEAKKTWKDVAKVSGKALEKAAAMGIEAAKEYKDALEELQEDIDRIKLSPEEFQAKQVMKKADYFREKGVEEVKIQEWIESQKLEIIKEYSGKQIDEIEKVQQAFERIGGISSPLMSMEEMATSIHSSFANNKLKPEIPTLNFNPPSLTPPAAAGNTGQTSGSSSIAGITAQGEEVGAYNSGVKKLNEGINKTPSQGQSVNNITIQGITISGEKANAFSNALKGLGIFENVEGI